MCIAGWGQGWAKIFATAAENPFHGSHNPTEQNPFSQLPGSKIVLPESKTFHQHGGAKSLPLLENHVLAQIESKPQGLVSVWWKIAWRGFSAAVARILARAGGAKFWIPGSGVAVLVGRFLDPGRSGKDFAPRGIPLSFIPPFYADVTPASRSFCAHVVTPTSAQAGSNPGAPFRLPVRISIRCWYPLFKEN